MPAKASEAAFAQELDVPFGVKLAQALVDALRVRGKKADAIIGIAFDAAIDFIGCVPRHTLYRIGIMFRPIGWPVK